MGRRKRRADDSGHKGQVEYFYPVSPGTASTLKKRNNSRVLNDDLSIKDNVGVTVIMPGGKTIES